jgi:hypothetical protein
MSGPSVDGLPGNPSNQELTSARTALQALCDRTRKNLKRMEDTVNIADDNALQDPTRCPRYIYLTGMVWRELGTLRELAASVKASPVPKEPENVPTAAHARNAIAEGLAWVDALEHAAFAALTAGPESAVAEDDQREAEMEGSRNPAQGETRSAGGQEETGGGGRDASPPDPSATKTDDSLDMLAVLHPWVSAPQLAKLLDVDSVNKVEKFLERLRGKRPHCFQPLKDPVKGEPQYLHRTADILSEIRRILPKWKPVSDK